MKNDQIRKISYYIKDQLLCKKEKIRNTLIEHITEGIEDCIDFQIFFSGASAFLICCNRYALFFNYFVSVWTRAYSLFLLITGNNSAFLLKILILLTQMGYVQKLLNISMIKQ